MSFDPASIVTSRIADVRARIVWSRPVARTGEPQVDRRIHEAMVALLQRDGLAGLTIDGVAARARVGKAAIYRRYDSKEDLVAAAVDAVLPMAQPVRAGGGRAALAAMVEDLRVALFASGGVRLLATLLVAAPHTDELLDLWRRRVVAPRVETVRRVLDEAGVIGMDPRLLGELAFGGLVTRFVSRADVPAWSTPTVVDRCRARRWATSPTVSSCSRRAASRARCTDATSGRCGVRRRPRGPRPRPASRRRRRSPPASGGQCGHRCHEQVPADALQPDVLDRACGAGEQEAGEHLGGRRARRAGGQGQGDDRVHAPLGSSAIQRC